MSHMASKERRIPYIPFYELCLSTNMILRPFWLTRISLMDYLVNKYTLCVISFKIISFEY